MAEDRFDRIMKVLSLVWTRGGIDESEFISLIHYKVRTGELDITDALRIMEYVDVKGDKVVLKEDAKRVFQELIKEAKKHDGDYRGNCT
ncbi:MAG: hypothetical protein L7H04_06055 [Vulcanisaeta sp.]|nr:hypothetical protein [Vulcanisaeta sp.]